MGEKKGNFSGENIEEKSKKMEAKFWKINIKISRMKKKIFFPEIEKKNFF